MRGRRRDDAEVREAKGTAVISPVQDSAREVGGAPDWLQSGAADVWKRLQIHLADARLVRGADTNALGRYCQYMSEWIDVNRSIAGIESLTYWTETRHGKLKRIEPLFNVRDRLESDLIKLEEHLGLTPRARLAILAHVAGGQPELPGLSPIEEDEVVGSLN